LVVEDRTDFAAAEERAPLVDPDAVPRRVDALDTAALAPLVRLVVAAAAVFLAAFDVFPVFAALVVFAPPPLVALAVRDALFEVPFEAEVFLDGAELVFFADERTVFLAPTATSISKAVPLARTTLVFAQQGDFLVEVPRRCGAL
jgi:hypothetical protein